MPFATGPNPASDARRAVMLDVSLGVALTVLLQLEVWLGEAEGEVFEHKPLSSALMLFLAVPLIWRRRAPVAVAFANGFGRAVQALVTASWVATFGILLATLVALYSCGAYARGRRAWLGLGAIGCGLLIATAHDIPTDETDLWNGLFFFLLAFFVYAAGLYVRGRRGAAELERRTARLERERERHERAVAEERARIARELHDVVAHGVSATVVQAEAADELLDRAPERARESLRRIQSSGRESLGEMRRLLGLMRPQTDSEPRDGQPRLADVDQLVGELREPGLSSTLTISGEPRPIPPGIELSAYRVVQEALTNVRRHAGRPVTVEVTVRYATDLLELEIADDGTGAAAGEGEGYGLIGMRERVEFFGGRITAGPGADAGFEVHAQFPLPADR